jgi:hypothetical protein
MIVCTKDALNKDETFLEFTVQNVRNTTPELLLRH